MFSLTNALFGLAVCTAIYLAGRSCTRLLEGLFHWLFDVIQRRLGR